MTDKIRFLKAAAVLVLLVAGAQLALANGKPPAQPQPNVSNATSVGIRRLGPGSVALPTNRLVSAPLSENECTGLGGVLTPNHLICGDFPMCETADANGEVHEACVTEKK